MKRVVIDQGQGNYNWVNPSEQQFVYYISGLPKEVFDGHTFQLVLGSEEADFIDVKEENWFDVISFLNDRVQKYIMHDKKEAMAKIFTFYSQDEVRRKQEIIQLKYKIEKLEKELKEAKAELSYYEEEE